MLKTLSTAAVSLSLIGSLAFAGMSPSTSTSTSLVDSKLAKHVMELPSPVQATPELAQFAKEKGIDLAQFDPAVKIIHEVQKKKGKKFEQPGKSHVEYKHTDDEIPMLVLLVNFKDEQAGGVGDMEIPAQYFQDLIFGDTYDPYQMDWFTQYDGDDVPKDRTMQNAYKESSYGKVELITYNNLADIGWVTLDQPASYYLGQDKKGVWDNENGFAFIGEMIADLLEKADDQIDFSQYAENGEVANMFIVHSGTGAEWSGDPAQIWSHKWTLQSALYWGEYYRSGYAAADYNRDGVVTPEELNRWYDETENLWTKDGVALSTYGIQPALGGNLTGYSSATGDYNSSRITGPYPAQVGVFAHEFGHVIGLPDYYDTDYSSEGVGNYSLMSGGSWTRYPLAPQYAGNSPIGFDPFSKIFLGWIDPIEVTPADGVQTITLPPVNTGDSNNTVVKMEVPGSNGTEYFLFENMQQVGFNKGIGVQGAEAKGLVVWHVDENVLSMYQTHGTVINNVENANNKRWQTDGVNIRYVGDREIRHYGLSVKQADGLYDLEHGVNRGDAGDFYRAGDSFTPNGNVHSGSYYFWPGHNSVPGNTGIHVTDIVENEDGSITANFYYNFGNKGKGKK